MQDKIIYRSIPPKPHRRERSMIMKLELYAGFGYQSTMIEDRIIMVLSGSAKIICDDHPEKNITSGDMIFIANNCHFKTFINSNLSIIALKLNFKEQFKGNLSLDYLNVIKPEIEYIFEPLKLQPRFIDYFLHLNMFLDDGIKSPYFFRLKIRELLYLMKFYYTPEQMVNFFYPLLDHETDFSDFIYNNYDKYRTVQELAEASCYSLSTFNKLFRRNFGTSPYSWINQQKAKHIYYDIHTSEKTIKEICNKHGFKSLSQFNHFCKKHFGSSPRQIREDLHMETTSENKVTE